MQVRNYQNDKGENRYVTEVVAEEIDFLNTKKPEEKLASAEEIADKNKPYEDFAREYQEEFVYTDDDLPF